MVALVDEPDPLARPDGADMSQPIECRYYGRDFSAEEMALLRALIAGPPALNRFALSKAFCRRIGWYKPDGGLKDMMARVTMLAMHKDGLIVLPPPKWGRNPAVPMIFGPDTDTPLEPPPETLDEVRPVRLQTVLGGTPQSQQWNAFIARYHYLGYKTLVGAQMRYIVHDRHGRLLALLGFSTAARKLAPRDRFIGWTPTLREKNLPKVIDNARFLILPWIRIPNLASHILSLSGAVFPVRIQQYRSCRESLEKQHQRTRLFNDSVVQLPAHSGYFGNLSSVGRRAARSLSAIQLMD